MTIYLIRHGETTGDIENRFGGDYDDELTMTGRGQAEQLRHDLCHAGIQTVLTSPLRRAQATAEILSQAYSIPMEIVPGFKERNHYGILTGLNKDEAKETHPSEVEKFERDGTYHDVGGSEPYEAFKTRVLASWEALGERTENTLAVVTHGGVIGCVLREVFGYDQSKIGDCGYIIVAFEQGTPKLVSGHNATW